MRNSYVMESSGSSVAPAPAPSIVATRRTLDNKFPFLAFAVDTRGLPFYEVLLATEPLFTAAVLADPAARDRQPADRFYSSRTDSGLIGQENQTYSVPPAVLQRFAGARAIYYTVIAFRDRTMNGAIPAASAETLAREAPSVSVMANFTGATLGAILSVPLHRLQTVPFSAPAWPWSVPTQERDAVDLAGGEDGHDAALDAPADEDEEIDAPAEPSGYGLALEAADEIADESFGADHDVPIESDYDDGFESAGQSYSSPEEAGDDDEAEGDAGESAAAAFADEEDASDVDAPSGAKAFDSTFEPDARPPEMLEDADHLKVEDEEGGYEERTPVAAEGYNDGYEAAQAAPEPAAAVPFGIAERRHVIDAVVRTGNPAANPYATVNTTGGFAFGHVGFQAGRGHLGRLLQAMKARHPAKFAEVFGPGSELIDVTTAGSGSPDATAVRLRPVGGQELSHPTWVRRFVESARPDLFGAGQPQLFNGAQNEVASELFLDPMLPIARGLGLSTDRGIALLFDVACRIGAAAAARWTMGTAGPIQSPAQRQQALNALGFAGLQPFQAANPGLQADGEWEPYTHAALAGALRRLGPGSPIPLPTGAQSLDTLVRQAPAEWAPRAQALARSAAFRDTAYAI